MRLRVSVDYVAVYILILVYFLVLPILFFSVDTWYRTNSTTVIAQLL